MPLRVVIRGFLAVVALLLIVGGLVTSVFTTFDERSVTLDGAALQCGSPIDERRVPPAAASGCGVELDYSRSTRTAALAWTVVGLGIGWVLDRTPAPGKLTGSATRSSSGRRAWMILWQQRALERDRELPTEEDGLEAAGGSDA